MSADEGARLSRERWRQIDSIFDEALDRDPASREDFLEAACEGDAELRREVEALLAADRRAPELFEQGALSFAAPAWDPGEAEEGGPEPGARLGAYRLLEEIGRGGMSRVYLAERDDDRLRRRVAIKVLEASTRHREELEGRFRAEGLLLASLSHPNIAEVYDAGVDSQGRPYLVMEHVDGKPITEHCDAESLEVSERLDLFRDVCSAVQHAHRHLVVHRDLKPGNILVDEEGRVKLLDFGIAKLLDVGVLGAGAGDLPKTRTGIVPMTPEYAAPEQVLAEEITTSTDVYALGLILFELLTGARLP